MSNPREMHTFDLSMLFKQVLNSQVDIKYTLNSRRKTAEKYRKKNYYRTDMQLVT